MRHQGGGHKRAYRLIDFVRNDKDGVPAKVAQIEYDPNRTANIALLHFADGEKRYIIAPDGLVQGAPIENGASADIKPGNNLPLRNLVNRYFVSAHQYPSVFVLSQGHNDIGLAQAIFQNFLWGRFLFLA